ncbi:PPR domain-containing protein/PPR_2 domain-containing protein/PPR_3 domain-containing protein/DYW_deaminase domain-containing protein [Cephalotus follicularis]|uniref:PPR domain-containing protein/PPR_2 domain-containing protein/PPR_3 domain-containing protein/DYW_deaminase domain-containing protein n=1 Tax=Cephalotus follicularis TaxID=3775 RepID=A0A1Q3CGZ0_CEPFO|nr:PPR domain-containing protein/PPR_2 domain-containing protein/PPR_3 domain-containing protein/DYW_deaminase domain-containing protein [Cephalotus follicularis]
MNYSQQLLSSCKTIETVKQFQAYLSKIGLGSDPYFAGKFLLHCATAIPNALHYARQLFIHFPNPDVFMYNTLIRGFSESDTPRHSIDMFIQLCRNSLALPDSFSFAFVIKGAANCRSLSDGIQLHCQALRHGLDTHLFVGTTLISMYGECGGLEFAREVFEEMAQPNVVAWNAVVTACFKGGDVQAADIMFGRMPVRNLTSWNVMLAGYMKAGELELARKAFLEMPVKDDVSWSTLIVGFAHNGCFYEALGSFRELQRVRMRPTEVSLTGVLSACAHVGAFEFGKILHGLIQKVGFFWIVSVNNALIDTYSKCGNLEMAQLVFERMPEKRSIVSWTTMISGLAMHGHGKEAIRLFHYMEKYRIRPDGITFISILYACSHAGLIEQGYEYFSKMKNLYCIEPAIEHYGCMVDLYGRAGKLLKAFEFVSQMPISPNVIIWRTLLGACSIHGNVELAQQVKERLSELDPNNSGDHVLLSNIYAVAGKWKDVATVRRSMIDQRIKKTPGWSMIEVDKIMHSFVAGARQNMIVVEAYEKLSEIMLRLRDEGGYVAEVGSVLHDIEEEEKEDSISKHSEKLAVAFGISRLCEGKSIRIVKNLRVCRDCHTVMKLISRVYALEIVVRDRSRFHTFKNGSCSCRDYW